MWSMQLVFVTRISWYRFCTAKYALSELLDGASNLWFQKLRAYVTRCFVLIRRIVDIYDILQKLWPTRRVNELFMAISGLPLNVEDGGWIDDMAAAIWSVFQLRKRIIYFQTKTCGQKRRNRTTSQIESKISTRGIYLPNFHLFFSKETRYYTRFKKLQSQYLGDT